MLKKVDPGLGRKVQRMLIGNDNHLSPTPLIPGKLPAKVRGLVEEWAEINQDSLMTMWNNKEFHKLPPLV